ncbi:hypothetical protein PGT21_020628 [Puccinia graminis f. sp. tritici]|uniref:Uncharacterized protein n=1 Tax=Puccinia graminis f. sp. tritici TaxID=56615 RepID=A0A5B0NER4_PUCGR|nr:hypothetical protein PGT21_020628 [Puccinia graminis f. sp. tritici]
MVKKETAGKNGQEESSGSECFMLFATRNSHLTATVTPPRPQYTSTPRHRREYHPPHVLFCLQSPCKLRRKAGNSLHITCFIQEDLNITVSTTTLITEDPFQGKLHFTSRKITTLRVQGFETFPKFVRKCFEICARRGGRPGPWSRYISQCDAKGIPKVFRRPSDSFSESFRSTHETPVVSKSTPKGYIGMIPKDFRKTPISKVLRKLLRTSRFESLSEQNLKSTPVV